MNDAVRRDTIKKALLQRAARDSQEWGFDREDRHALAALVLNRDHVGSFKDLDERQLRFYIAVLRATGYVIELLRQNRDRKS